MVTEEVEYSVLGVFATSRLCQGDGKVVVVVVSRRHAELNPGGKKSL